MGAFHANQTASLRPTKISVRTPRPPPSSPAKDIIHVHNRHDQPTCHLPTARPVAETRTRVVRPGTATRDRLIAPVPHDPKSIAQPSSNRHRIFELHSKDEGSIPSGCTRDAYHTAVIV